MLIYFALLIPIVFSVIYFLFFNEYVTLKEHLISFGITSVFIIVAKLLVYNTDKTFTEYHNYYVKEVQYFEPWNEYIHKTCTRSYSCGNNKTCTETYDCSYVQYHDAEFVAIFNNDESRSISEHEYNDIKHKFGNSTFKELDRNYHTIDGNEYFSIFKNGSELVYAAFEESYTNRVKESDLSVFDYKKIPKDKAQKLKLYDYPEYNGIFNYNSVIGSSNINIIKEFNYVNAVLSDFKNVRIVLCVYDGNKTNVGTGLNQEAYWIRGNNNEVVVCVGIVGNECKWCHVFSWTKANIVNIKIRDYINDNKANINWRDLSVECFNVVKNEYKYRDFKEFDYLTIDPETWQIVLVYVLALIVNIIIAYKVVTNEETEL